jgi:DNA-binding CsgD family transcriptional regulator
VLVQTVTNHPMAGSLLVALLNATISVPVAVCAPNAVMPARVAVVLAIHEPPSTLPRILRRVCSVVPSVILAFDGAIPSDDLLGAAHRIGVTGSFDMRSDPRILVDHVRGALSGRRWENDRSSTQRPAETDSDGLTRREREVISCLFADPVTTIDEVAVTLGISVNTVRAHLANVRRKFDGTHVRNREALMAALADRGLLHH